MTQAKYSEQDLDRIERGSEDLLAEAQAALGRAAALHNRPGLADTSVSGFFKRHGASEELDKLRDEHIGDPSRELMEEERRLLAERKQAEGGAAAPKRRRKMTPV